MTRQAWIRVMAALCGCLPLTAAFAQGALKPEDAHVVNPPSRPVPVTVLSAPAPANEGAREVYSTTYSVIFSNQYRSCVSATVPAGKRLVLEHVSAGAGALASAALSYISLEDAVPRLFVPAAPPIGSGFGAAGQLVRAYFDASFAVCATATQINDGYVSVALNGFLVARP